MRRTVTGPDVVRWIAERTGEFGNYGASVGIGIERLTPDPDPTLCKPELIGGVVFYDWNGVNINMGTAGVTGSNWLTRSALRDFFRYPFIQLGAKRVTALVGEGNVKSQMLVEGVGFVLETTLADAHLTGDLLVYRLLPAECRWIKREVVKHERMAA